MIPFKFAPIVRFTVEGTYNDDAGVSHPFSFWLKCERWPADKIDAFIKQPGSTLRDLMTAVVKDWGDVKDPASGDAVPYSADNLGAFLLQPGLALLCVNRYSAEAGAKAKN